MLDVKPSLSGMTQVDNICLLGLWVHRSKLTGTFNGFLKLHCGMHWHSSRRLCQILLDWHYGLEM